MRQLATIGLIGLALGGCSKPADKIKASIAVDEIACSAPKQPLKISVANESSETIASMTVAYQSFPKGRSGEIGHNSFYSDSFVAPGETITFCVAYEMPLEDSARALGHEDIPLSDRDHKVTISSVEFGSRD